MENGGFVFLNSINVLHILVGTEKLFSKRNAEPLLNKRKEDVFMLLPCNNSAVNVKDIYAIIQIRTDLFVDKKMQKTDMPYGIAEGTLFLLRDGTMRYSDAKPEWIAMKIMSES